MNKLNIILIAVLIAVIAIGMYFSNQADEKEKARLEERLHKQREIDRQAAAARIQMTKDAKGTREYKKFEKEREKLQVKIMQEIKDCYVYSKDTKRHNSSYGLDMTKFDKLLAKYNLREVSGAAFKYESMYKDHRLTIHNYKPQANDRGWIVEYSYY